MFAAKIGTCCYCGTRAAFRLDRAERVELTCRACGAPISALKPMKAPVAAQIRRAPPKEPASFATAPPRKKRPARKRHSEKRRRGGLRRSVEKLFDELEDLFDDLFD